MKGLEKIPSEEDLLKAYSLLQFSKQEIPLHEISLWSQWCRFDARLAEILIQYFEKNWLEISPLDFNAELIKTPWPAVMGVLLDQMKFFIKFSKTELSLFKNWSKCVMTGIQNANHELFFIGTYGFASERMREDVVKSNKSFLNRGYFGTDLFFNKAKSNKKTLIPAKTRHYIINAFLKKHQRLTVAEYRGFFDGWVSMRQAQYDLSNHPRLKPRGNTRGRFFVRD